MSDDNYQEKYELLADSSMAARCPESERKLMRLVLVFDHVIQMVPVTWKRTRIDKHGTHLQIFNEKKMAAAKRQLGWEVKLKEPQLRCDAQARFGFIAHFYICGNRGDGDNFEKLLLDALQGVVWENDGQVDEGQWAKVYNRPKSEAGIKLRIYRIEESAG